jgi:hypothetical protein
MSGDRLVRRLLAAGLGAVALSAVAVAAVPPLLTDEPTAAPVTEQHAASAQPTPSIGPGPSSVPSQSTHDARRDGIVPAVAALPLAQRVNLVQEATSDEGVWVLSRLPSSSWGDDGAVGDTTGDVHRDWVPAYEYAELLLLDAGRERVLRAYPLPAMPAQSLLVQPDAVYCARQGDGALPDSMLCRVDRRTFALTVRVFPHRTAGLAPTQQPGWTWDEPGAGVVFEELTPCGGAVCVRGPDGQREVDPATLELLP